MLFDLHDGHFLEFTKRNNNVAIVRTGVKIIIIPIAFDARRPYTRSKAILKIEGFMLKPIQKKVVIASRLR